MSLVLKIKKLHPEAKIPTYQYAYDAAFDMTTPEEVMIQPMQRVQVPSGLAMEIPEGYVGLIWDKSGLSHRFGLKTVGGVIDSGYRGEVKVGMINLSNEPYTFKKGDKVAQMIIQKREDVVIEETEALTNTERGTGGFGSSGK